MNTVITGISSVRMNELNGVVSGLSRKVQTFRFVCSLEKLTVAAVELVLKEAGIEIPAARESIGLYIGIDDAIEEVKNAYFRNILDEGLLGASPLLFPFTSPNALAAQATILFDIRGESIVMPCRGSMKEVAAYADERVSGSVMKIAIVGGIYSLEGRHPEDRNNHEARFYIIERLKDARERGARIHDREMELLA